MKRTIAKTLLVLLAMFIGWGIVSTAPQVAEQYRHMRSADDSMATPFLALVGFGAFLVLGGAGYVGFLIWRELANPRPKRHRDIESMSTRQIQRETDKRIDRAKRNQSESRPITPEQRDEREELRRLDRKSQDSILEVVVFGAINGGKSSLLNALCGEDRFGTDVVGGATTQSSEITLPGCGKIILRDTPGLQEVFGDDRALIAHNQVGKADVVVFVIADDLRDFERYEISDVSAIPKRVLVCFNKRDRFTTKDCEALHKRIIERLDGIVEPDDIVSTQAIDVTRSVQIEKPDGSTSVREEIIPRDVSALTDRLLAVLDGEGHKLLLRTMLQRARELQAPAPERKH
ncbi:MAG: hypothetical protein GXP29_03450 [Planctomycetes bacterium]|nr:hypothetical protein [Planctomycetota bacterium]